MLAVAAMLTGRTGTAVSTDMHVCPADLGCADIPGNIIHLQPRFLSSLGDIADADQWSACRAILVFAHEARHVRGTRNESTASAWAKSHVYRVARLLGASDSWARGITRYASFQTILS